MRSGKATGAADPSVRRFGMLGADDGAPRVKKLRLAAELGGASENADNSADSSTSERARRMPNFPQKREVEDDATEKLLMFGGLDGNAPLRHAAASEPLGITEQLPYQLAKVTHPFLPPKSWCLIGVCSFW
jgi:hypothetical protein